MKSRAKPKINFHIVTLFPEAFSAYLGESIIKRAIEDGKVSIKFYNPKDYAEPASSKALARKLVDDRPYGGGPGMVMRAMPVIKAIAKAKAKNTKAKIIFLSPGGKQFTNDYAQKTAKKYKDIIIVSGRYEGVDTRVKKIFKMEDISVGPFILTGGELPAMILIDCISRQSEGVLGNFNSLEESRISSEEMYTRPEILEYKGKKYRVPKILLSGHQAKIEEWKRKRI